MWPLEQYVSPPVGPGTVLWLKSIFLLDDGDDLSGTPGEGKI